MWGGEPEALARARDDVIERLGHEALVDAVAVSANFHMMTRIADGTGTPIDNGSVEPTESIRAALGINHYVSRRHAPPRAG